MNITFYVYTESVKCVIQSLLLSYILNKNETLPPGIFFCCAMHNCVLYRVCKKMMFKISGVIFHFVLHVWISVMQNTQCRLVVSVSAAPLLYTKPASTRTSHESCLAYRHYKKGTCIWITIYWDVLV
jgi:hypothetical protein